MDELMLDGNAVAGMLGEVFAVEMTTATMTCGNCGTSGAVGGDARLPGRRNRHALPELRQRRRENRSTTVRACG